MINRDNYAEILGYLDYQATSKQSDKMTVNAYWSRLRHLLEWADDKRFTDAQKIKPTYPAYVETLKNRYGDPIGAAQFDAICKTARAFFLWAGLEYPRQYKAIKQNWVMSIRPPRSRSEQAELKRREVYEPSEVLKLATCQVEGLAMRRAQAAAAFLFLSGMRVGAFVTMPARCVDIQNMRVYQLPEMGVMTKNHKAAITTLLNIPELLEVIKKWDEFVKAQAGAGGLWYAKLTANGEIDDDYQAGQVRNRHHNLRDELRALCDYAGIEYKSPHKFRHGHAVYGVKRAKTIEHLKAISQNLMHSSIGITDGIYGRLVEDDVHAVILGLEDNPGGAMPAGIDVETLARALAMAQNIQSQKDGA